MPKSIGTATDPEILQELGGRLRGLRKVHGLTLEEVAERTGLDRTTVGRAERGDNPTLLTVIRILRTYGRLSALDHLIPEPEVSPMALVRKGKGRGG